MELPQIIKILYGQMLYVATKDQAALLCEESGTKIAELQGYCAGVKKFSELLQKVDYNTTDVEETEPWADQDDPLPIKKLEKIVAMLDELEEDPVWELLVKYQEEEIEAKKNTLYYESEKGRDLYFIKAWHKAITQIDTWAADMKAQYEIRIRTEGPELDFDDE